MEMNIELSRDEQQSERKGKRLESGGRNMYTRGVEAVRVGDKSSSSSVQSRAQCPLACDLRQVSPILSLKFFLDKMGMILLVTLSFVGLTYRKTC